MSIENDIFKRKRLKPETLIPYGFVKNGNAFEYSKPFMDGGFRADIAVDEKGAVGGRVFDAELGEEYANFRIKNPVGEFVNDVLREYIDILEDIAAHCFEELYFVTDQANRLTESIIAKYGNAPEFPWEKHRGFGVFRNEKTRKWYCVIMNIDKSKLESACSGEVEVLNIKLTPAEIQSLLQERGFYECYHMDKKHWITIILDGTLTDEVILKYIEKSHGFSVK